MARDAVFVLGEVTNGFDDRIQVLAVDRVGFDYLPAMFGPGGWHVLPHPNRLPEVLTTVYGRVTGA